MRWKLRGVEGASASPCCLVVYLMLECCGNLIKKTRDGAFYLAAASVAGHQLGCASGVLPCIP